MEIKKRRFATLTAGVAITALMVTACGGSGASNSPNASMNGAGQTLTVLMGVDGKYGAQQQQWFKDVSAAFEKQTGATVTFQTFTSGNEELTKIQTSVVLTWDRISTSWARPSRQPRIPRGPLSA